MKEFWNAIKMIITFLGGWLGKFLGGNDGLIIALAAFTVIDYISGIVCAVNEKKLSSKLGFNGIIKKILIFALVGTAHIIDTLILGDGAVMRTAVIFFYLSNEGISLLENICSLGLPVPSKLKEVLIQLHKGEEKNDI